MDSERQPGIRCGHFPEFELTDRMFPSLANYLDTPRLGCLLEQAKRAGLDEVHDALPRTAYLYVPDGCDGSDAKGLFLHIPANDQGSGFVRFKKLFARHKLIYLAPNHAGNKTPFLIRMILTLDALATARQKLRFGQDRIILSGYSGGGVTAVLTALNHPSLFPKIISVCRGVMLRNTPSGEGRQYWPKAKLSPDKDTLKAIARMRQQWAFVTGDQDFNYRSVLRSAPHWKELGLDYRIFDLEGLTHQLREAQDLGSAFDSVLRWLDGEEVPGYEPRYVKCGIEIGESNSGKR